MGKTPWSFSSTLLFMIIVLNKVFWTRRPTPFKNTLVLRLNRSTHSTRLSAPPICHAYPPRLSAPPIWSAPVEDGGYGAPHKVPAYALVAVDEEPRVLRTSSFPANVERSNALTAVEVVSLWASLAVPPNHRVDRCAKEVGCGPAQVKESRLCACCW